MEFKKEDELKSTRNKIKEYYTDMDILTGFEFHMVSPYPEFESSEAECDGRNCFEERVMIKSLAKEIALKINRMNPKKECLKFQYDFLLEKMEFVDLKSSAKR